MNLEHHKPLQSLNSFGFSHHAEHFVAVADDQELQEALSLAYSKGWPWMVLGGGSNLVLTRDVPGLVIQPIANRVHWSAIESASGSDMEVTADAGKNWHALVRETVESGWRGLENLSLIPGSAGAAPVQNIGAYGVELMDRFSRLRALHAPTGEWHIMTRSDCEFAYRNSLFKRCAGEYIITSVTMTVGRELPLNTAYSSLAAELEQQGLSSPTALQVSDAVCAVRRSRLPDPSELGNAGSFFHNPIVDADTARELRARHDGLVGYEQADGSVKLAAGWLIDSLGFRGLRRGAVGVHEHQALVLVHFGNGSSQQLMTLASEIQRAVEDAYGVSLSIEPQVL